MLQFCHACPVKGGVSSKTQFLCPDKECLDREWGGGCGFHGDSYLSKPDKGAKEGSQTKEGLGRIRISEGVRKGLLPGLMLWNTKVVMSICQLRLLKCLPLLPGPLSVYRSLQI